MSTSKVPAAGNKPGEPPFQMKLEPEGKIIFKYKLGEPCTVEMKITNTTKERQTFKVKCTDNEIFRVRPPLAFVKPEECASVKITFNSKTLPESNRHFFAVYHMKCGDAGKTARQVWTPESKPEGVARVIAQFEDMAKEEGESKEKKDEKEEKKTDEDKKEDKEEKKNEKKEDKKEEKK